MDRDVLLLELKKKTGVKSFKLPSGVKFSLNGNTLKLEIESGLNMNMQTNDSAFEGWAVCLKFNLPTLIDNVNITWDANNADKENIHYKRFLYRVWKFINAFSWATCDSYKFDNYSTDGWIINHPKIEASKAAEKPEAKLEREYIEQHKAKYDCICNQLPVGLFYKKIGKSSRVTPGQNSQIDIWAIKEDTLSLFELKNDTNKSVGIITELMFYINVMNDLVNGSIGFESGSKNVTVRHFDKLYKAITGKKVKKIEGCFLTNALHPMISKRVIDGMNAPNSNITYRHKLYNEHNHS